MVLRTARLTGLILGGLTLVFATASPGPGHAQDTPSPPSSEPVAEAAPPPPQIATAAAPLRRHAASLVGDPKFGPDFKHFDWVNPDAPKGGTVRISLAPAAFDSFNPFSVQGTPERYLGLVYDALMVASVDEPSTEYGLIAEWISYPEDYSSVTFGLRPAARFHDGAPITPEDVIFSLQAVRKANPFFEAYYKNVVKAEKTGPHDVTFTFDQTGNRELPQILGQLSVLPKHFWETKTAGGEPRDITKSTSEIPLGSGAYKIVSFVPGRTVVYERVKDYWAKDLPVMRGQWNFDEIRVEYFRDRGTAFEAFKAGQLDYWQEVSATDWSTKYDIPAVQKKRILRHVIPDGGLAPMQAFAFNMRRKQFQDVNVRRAFHLVFNFEDMNKLLFYGQYRRVESYFGNSELAARGVPEGRELEFLNDVRDKVPPEVFTTEWKNPTRDTPEKERIFLTEASRLLDAAGWTIRDNTAIRRNAAGETLSAEIMVDSASMTRVAEPYAARLKLLGIVATVRVVDDTQHQRREATFDFDIIVDTIAQSHSPGNEQRSFFGSETADETGSRNKSGIKNPAVDALIDKIIFAKNRADLVAATQALDRVLLWNFYRVPQYYNPNDWLATWDMFGRPEKLPLLSPGFLQVWWMDEAKKQALAASPP